MKIASSNLQFNALQNEQQSSARIVDTNVRSVGSGGSRTLSSQANIIQAQQQTLKDSIHSASTSQVKDSNGGKTTLESALLLQSLTQVNLSEDITVRAVGITNGNEQSQEVSNIQVSRIMAFETETDIQIQTLGHVTTEDGREIDFMLELNYNREMEITQASQFSSNRNLIDPLVINLNGEAVSLSDQYFEFDLNSNGQTQSLHQTASGTGFLAFDKNQNGKIDNGSELFGPETGHGFGELSQYDDDKNGWIDENDAIFSQLSFMDFDENGNQRLQSISDAGIGAIALESREMNFDLYDNQGDFQAQIAQTGVALNEDGRALAIQEIYYEEQAFGQGRLEQVEVLSSNTGEPGIKIQSALTQFQFDNAIINQRNADTHVTLELPQYSNRIGEDTYQEIDPNFSIQAALQTNTSSESSASTAQALNVTQESSFSSEQVVSQSFSNEVEKRAAIQAEFQYRIEHEYKHIQQTNHQNNKSRPVETLEIATQNQSVFWEYSGIEITSGVEDSKLSELKNLIEDLKVIREQQLKGQEKLGIYIQISDNN